MRPELASSWPSWLTPELLAAAPTNGRRFQEGPPALLIEPGSRHEPARPLQLGHHIGIAANRLGIAVGLGRLELEPMGDREVAPAVITPFAAAMAGQKEATGPLDVLIAITLKQRIHIPHFLAQHGCIAAAAGP